MSFFKLRIVFQKKRVDLLTKIHPIFTEFRRQFYPSMERCTKSIVPLNLLQKIDLLGLMIWYLDDGNSRKSSWGVSIGAKGWDSTGLEGLIKLINDKFDLSLYVYRCKHYDSVNQVVKIPYKDRSVLDLWTSLAEKHLLPDCMKYKLELKYSH